MASVTYDIYYMYIRLLTPFDCNGGGGGFIISLSSSSMTMRPNQHHCTEFGPDQEYNVQDPKYIK